MYIEQHKYFDGLVAARIIEEIRSKKLIRRKKFQEKENPL
jgi:hypothetical protein